MKFNYEKLGNLIEISEKKNSDLAVEKLVGMNINKEFIPSVANTIGTDLSKYKVIKKNQFAYNPMQVGRDRTIRIARYQNDDSAIISPAYKIFQVIDENILLPEFLMLYFMRSEFDRVCWFHTDSSIRGSMDWYKFCDLKIPLPNLEVQKKIVDIYQFFNERIELKERINNNLENLIINIFKDRFFKFSLSSDFEDSEFGLIPKGWLIDYLGSGNVCSIIRSGINDFDDTKIYLATADVIDSKIINSNTLITFKNKPSRARMQPIKKSLWFAKMINSRKLIMVDDFSKNLIDNYIFSTGFCGIKCSEEVFYYLWTFLLTNEFNYLKDSFCTGTTQQAINTDKIKSIKFILPDKENLIKFNNIARPLYKTLYYNNLEISNLVKSRDFVIKKYLSTN